MRKKSSKYWANVAALASRFGYIVIHLLPNLLWAKFHSFSVFSWNLSTSPWLFRLKNVSMKTAGRSMVKLKSFRSLSLNWRAHFSSDIPISDSCGSLVSAGQDSGQPSAATPSSKPMSSSSSSSSLAYPDGYDPVNESHKSWINGTEQVVPPVLPASR